MTLAVDGTLRFVRYGFMPNRLRYCGPDENKALLDHAVENVTDAGLRDMLARFTGAVPYLRLIAHANGIADPFDARVVEAYWIGNELLEGVEVRALYDSLVDRFGKQLSGRTRDLILGKAPAGARPHHSFHVLDVHSRLGELPATLATLDSCRVSWGRVVSTVASELVVERRPLVLHEGRLALGGARAESVTRTVAGGSGFVSAARPGDWVAIHWSWACEVLTEKQRRELERWTAHHLTLANATL